MSGTSRKSVSVGWWERWQGRRSRGLKMAIRALEALEAHIRLTYFFLRVDECETRSAFIGGKAGDCALRSLAAVHKEVLIALEGAYASFEKGNLRVEAVNKGAAVVP